MSSNLSERIVDSFLEELNGRAGFDSLWDSLDDDVKEDIKESLKQRIQELI